jgi:hypothetical protein
MISLTSTGSIFRIESDAAAEDAVAIHPGATLLTVIPAGPGPGVSLVDASERAARP